MHIVRKNLPVLYGVIFFLALSYGDKRILLLALIFAMWIIIEPTKSASQLNKECFNKIKLKYVIALTIVKIILYIIIMPIIFYCLPVSVIINIVPVYFLISIVMIVLYNYVKNNNHAQNIGQWLILFLIIEDIYIPSTVWIASWIGLSVQEHLSIFS